ncbi:MAG: zinc ABC transporter substrate-binding protein, partial [Candidatus Dadabacteria bacterium]
MKRRLSRSIVLACAVGALLAAGCGGGGGGGGDDGAGPGFSDGQGSS